MNWFKLHPKVQTALAALVGLDSATVIAGVNGTLTWKEVAAALLGIDIPVLIAYLTPSKPTPPPAV